MCTDEINRISNDTISDNIIDFSTAKSVRIYVEGNTIRIPIEDSLSIYINDIEDGKYKSIAIISMNEINDFTRSGAKYFVAARNITGLHSDEAIRDWYISSYNPKSDN